MNKYNTDELKSREKHIKLTTFKMDYTILKTSKKDVFDYIKGIPHSTWGQKHYNILQGELSEIKSKLEFLIVKPNRILKKCPSILTQ